MRSYEAVLASVGYEPRSLAISKALGVVPSHAVAVGFPRQQTPSYMASLRWFREHGFSTNDEWENRFLPFVWQWLAMISSSRPGARVLIDVSSMNRPRIAAVVQALSKLAPETELTLDLLYAPSKYQPPKGLPDGILKLDPVSSYFGGQLGSRVSPVALVGLGYEPHKAAGALDDLEIKQAVAFVPIGTHQSYHGTVLRANRGLLEGPDEHVQVDYEVTDPFDCFARLDGRVHGLLRSGAVPAIIPLGPKIFALSSCLVAALHHPHVSVWRASFGKDERPVRRVADGWVCGLTVRLAPALPGPDAS